MVWPRGNGTVHIETIALHSVSEKKHVGQTCTNFKKKLVGVSRKALNKTMQKVPTSPKTRASTTLKNLK